MLVKDYMTPDPLKVSTRESVNWIAELIRVHKIRQVPVVDASNRLVGIVTDRDIRSATGPEQGDRLQLVAEDIMTPKPVTIEPNAELAEAARLLHDHPFGALPVVEGDRVVGIITTRDLLGKLIELLEGVAAQRPGCGAWSSPF